MLRREMGSKRGSVPPKEGDLTFMKSCFSGAMEMMPYFENKRKKRKAVRRQDLRWPNGDVVYKFAYGHFSELVLIRYVFDLVCYSNDLDQFTFSRIKDIKSNI